MKSTRSHQFQTKPIPRWSFILPPWISSSSLVGISVLIGDDSRRYGDLSSLHQLESVSWIANTGSTWGDWPLSDSWFANKFISIPVVSISCNSWHCNANWSKYLRRSAKSAPSHHTPVILPNRNGRAGSMVNTPQSHHGGRKGCPHLWKQLDS